MHDLSRFDDESRLFLRRQQGVVVVIVPQHGRQIQGAKGCQSIYAVFTESAVNLPVGIGLATATR